MKRGRSKEEEVAEDFEASVELLEASRVAFEVAGEFLSETDDFLFVYYLKNGERKLSQIEDCVTQDDALSDSTN